MVMGGDGCAETKCTLSPDIRRAVFQHRQQREDSAIGEINVTANAARLAQDVTKLGFDSFNIRIDPHAAGTVECIQQPVL
jgi:hypothetical protein